MIKKSISVTIAVMIMAGLIIAGNAELFKNTYPGFAEEAAVAVMPVPEELCLEDTPTGVCQVACDDCIGQFGPVPGEEYIVSGWVKLAESEDQLTYSAVGIALEFFDGGSTPVGTSVLIEPAGKIIDGWQRMEGKVQVPVGAEEIQIHMTNGNLAKNAFFDDVRVHPVKSNMKSFVYDPVSLRLMAELDENNYATFYEYDHEGKLTRVKKETERGIETIQESKYGSVKAQ